MLLKHNLTGLAVTDTQITFAQLDDQGAVIAYSAYALPPGVVQEGRIVDQAAFAAACQAARQEASPVPIDDPFGVLSVSLALPESQLWSHTEAVPKHVLQSEIEAFLTKKAATVMPIDLAAYTTDHVVTSVHGVTYATLVAVESTLVKEYVAALRLADMNVERVGSSFYAAAQAVLPRSFGADNFLIIDLEPSYTNVGVFDENAIAYMVIQSATVHDSAHERSLAGLVDDVTRLRSHFLTATKQQITQIVVVGQHPDTVALAGDLEGNFVVPITLGDPLRHVENPALFEPVSAPIVFASALGAALSGVDRTLPHVDLTPEEPGAVSAYLQSPLMKLRRLLNGAPPGDMASGSYTKLVHFIHEHALLAVSLLCLGAIGLLFLVAARYLFV